MLTAPSEVWACHLGKPQASQEADGGGYLGKSLACAFCGKGRDGWQNPGLASRNHCSWALGSRPWVIRAESYWAGV